jgi:hypothetical protein
MTPRCAECGTELQQATIDVAQTPEVDPAQDYARAEFDAQHMAAVGFCPNPDCPRHREPGSAEDAGAML